MDLEKDGLADTLARTLWGWVAVLTMTLAMCALFLARWWQSLPEHAGSFGAEFRQIRLGRVLGSRGGRWSSALRCSRSRRWSTTSAGCSWARW